ncbi:MAG: hypothetical protein WCD21_33740 [Streptomyces sp.]
MDQHHGHRPTTGARQFGGEARRGWQAARGHDFWIKRTKGGGAHYIQVSTRVGFKAASCTSASACG